MTHRIRMARKRLMVAQGRQLSTDDDLALVEHNPKPTNQLYLRAIERRKDRLT